MDTDFSIGAWSREHPYYKKHPEALVVFDHPTLRGIATKFNKEFGAELVVLVISYDHPNAYKVVGGSVRSDSMTYEQTLEYFRALRKEYREITPSDRENLAALNVIVDEINEEFGILCGYVEFFPSKGFHIPGPRIIGGEIVGSEYMTYKETLEFLRDLRWDYRRIIADNRKHAQQVFDFEKSCDNKKEKDMPDDKKMSLKTLVEITRDAKIKVTVSIPVLAILSNSNTEVADAVSERLEEALEGLIRDCDKPEPVPTHDIDVVISSDDHLSAFWLKF